MIVKCEITRNFAEFCFPLPEKSIFRFLGGYLHHIALPLARYAYYSGHVECDSVAKLHKIYDEIKAFLKTSGETWADPIIDFGDYQNVIRPIHSLTDSVGYKPCDDLIFEENPGNFQQNPTI